LKGGDRIVVEGVQKVRSGMKVKPVLVPAEPPAATVVDLAEN